MREYKTRLNPKGVIKMEAVYSRFSMRMRIAAISLLMVFFSQQVSWACGYNLSLLVNPLLSPRIYQDHAEFNRLVAKRVYSMLKPSFMYKAQELKSAYQWLKQPSTQTVPCSAYVLYNLLQAKGIKPKIEDISASLISLDLKAGNLKPPFTASRIDNSLYALAKTAESQGLLLYPFRLNSITPELLNSLNSQTPFIAHLNYSEALDKGHFVLVTGIDTDKVHFFYDKGNTFLPLEKFLEEFSGYCLLSSASVGTEHCSVPTISDAEAQAVLGAKSYKGVKVDYTKLFKEPSTKDLLIGFGVSVGTMFGGSMLSGMRNGQGLSFGKAFAGLGAGIAQAEISKASVNFSVQQFKMKPLYAQIVGYGVSGAMSGAIGGIGNDTNFKFKGDNFFSNFMNKHSIFRGATMGFVQGGMQGTGSVLAYQGIKNTSFYKDNPFIARQAAGLLGSAVGYMGFYAMTGAMRMNVNIDKNNNKVFGVDQKEGVSQITYSDGSMHNRISSDGMTGGAGVFNNVKLALADSSFLSSMISQGTALGVEWAAGPKYAKYSRLLGQGIGSVAGGLATGNGISPWKMMMNGALSGGISLGLGYLGGEVGPDGKNKLGLTDIQMAGVEWLGTATLYSGIGAAMSKTPGTTFADAFGQRFGEFSTDYVSFGRTSPLYTKGAGGWSSFMYNQKIADFGGFANYKANADYSMKLQGYKSWCKFVDDGKAANLLPSFSNSLVRYASTSLHYGAVSNAVATVGWFPKSVTNFLGIEKHRVNNENMASLEKKLDAAKIEMDQDKIQTIEALLTEIKSSNSNGNDRWHSWIVVSQPNSLSESGYSFFTLGGSRIGFNEKGKLNFLLTHLRKPMEGQVKVGSKYYNLGEGYTKEDMAALSKEGAKAIPIIESNKKPGEAAFVNLANLLFYAQDDGYLSVGLKRTLNNDNGEFLTGRVSTKHEKGKPTITDIFTAQQVTPKKFWFDKKININTGVTLAVYNRQINTDQGLKYLGKNKEGIYPAAGFGYSESGGIVTKDGDKWRISNNEMIVELSALGQGEETKTKEITKSSAPAIEKQEQPQQPTQTANNTGEKEQSKSLELTKSEDAVKEEAKKDPEKELRKVERKKSGRKTPDSIMYNGKNYGNTTADYKRALGAAIEDALVQDPDNIALQKAENFLSEKYENVESAEVILDRYNKAVKNEKAFEFSWSNDSLSDKIKDKEVEIKEILASKAGDTNRYEYEGKLYDTYIGALEVKKSIKNPIKPEEKVTIGETKAEDFTSKSSEPVKPGEKITTTTTATPKITTVITSNKDDLSNLSSRDNGSSKVVGGSTYGVVLDAKVSFVPLTQTEVASLAKPAGGSGLPPALEALHKEFSEASDQLVNARTIWDSVSQEAMVNKDISAKDIETQKNYLQKSEERYAKASLDLTQGLLKSEQIVPYSNGSVMPKSEAPLKSEETQSGLVAGRIGGNGESDILGDLPRGGVDFYNSGDFKAYDGKAHPVDLFYKSGKPNEKKYDILYGVNYNENNENKTDLWYRPRSEIKQEKQKDLTEYFSKMETSGNGKQPVAIKETSGKTDNLAGIPHTDRPFHKPEEIPLSDPIPYDTEPGTPVNPPVVVHPVTGKSESIGKDGELVKRIEQLVMVYDEQGGNLRLEQNSGIKMPQGYNISAKVNEKSRGDVINELYLYNTEFSSGKANSTTPGKQKVIAEKGKASLPGGDADAHVNAYKAATDGKKSNDQSGGTGGWEDYLNQIPSPEGTSGLTGTDVPVSAKKPAIRIGPIDLQVIGHPESFDKVSKAAFVDPRTQDMSFVPPSEKIFMFERNAKPPESDDKIIPNKVEFQVDSKELRDGGTQRLEWRNPVTIPADELKLSTSFTPDSRVLKLPEEIQRQYERTVITTSPRFREEASKIFLQRYDEGLIKEVRNPLTIVSKD